MKVALIVEQDLTIQAQLKAALAEVDPQVEAIFFDGLRPLIGWLKEKLGIGESAENPPSQKKPENRIALVISQTELFGKHPGRLIKKAKTFFQRKGLIDEGAALEFILTANPGPRFKIERHRDAAIFNVIMHPIDTLMLRQSLLMALQSDKVPPQGLVFRQKIKGPIEMLKDVFVEAIGDGGFITRSERAIETGLIGKYYLGLLEGELPNFVYGRCIESRPHPQFAGAFLCTFSFFGARAATLTAIRKILKGRSKTIFFRPDPLEGPLPSASGPISLVIVDRNEERFSELKSFFERTLKSVRVTQLKSYMDLLCQLDPKMAGFEVNDLQISARKFDIELKTNKILGITPDLVSSFVGYKQPEIVQKEQFLDKAALPEDQKLLSDYLSNTTEVGQKEVIRFQNKKGRFHLVEFNRVGAQKDSCHYEVRELALADIEEYFQTVKPLGADAIYIHSTELGEGFKERLPILSGALARQKSVVPLFALRELQKDPLSLDWMSPALSDVFELPGDRLQMILRLIQLVPQKLKAEDRLNYQMARIQSLGKVARQAEFSELSESTVVVPYYRPIDIGDQRSFHFPKMDSTNVLEFWARCAYVDSQNKGDSICYFHFFGLSDTFLKALRNNIRESFVLLKEKENSGE